MVHIPIIITLLWGIVEIGKNTALGDWIAVIAGLGGFIPYLIHKELVRREGYLNSTISNVIIYANVVSGIGTILSALHIFN